MASLSSYDGYGGYYAQLVVDQTPPEPAFLREYYRVLFAYYQQNGLYDFLNQQLQATKRTNAAIKPIRNPAHRVVEFYASKLFPGALPQGLEIVTENQAIIPAIHQVWNWGNFSSVKQKWARWFAIFGDWFIKISTAGDPVSRVYMTIIRPEHVTDMKTDERDFLTYIRIDVPTTDVESGDTTWHTEVWDKENQTVTIWSHEDGPDKTIEELPTPVSTATFEQTHGSDFIPIVYQPFRDDGGGRGNGCFSAQLDKIDEVNQEATRLAQILFRYNRPIWAAMSTGSDASGRPLPPISMDNLTGSDGVIQFGKDDILALPSSSELKALVPQINYADALEVLMSQMQELERDLPELAYYQLQGFREISGRAIRFLLDAMISRVIEARGNAETGLERAHSMALTIGQNFNLEPFGGIGLWEEGAFRHGFEDRPVLPEDEFERSEMVRNYALAGAAIDAAGRAAGMTEAEAEDLAAVGTSGETFEEDVGGR